MKYKIINSINIILKDIKRDAISRKHRHAELHLDCPECKFRILEGCLLWYKDLLLWDIEMKSKNEKSKTIGTGNPKSG